MKKPTKRVIEAYDRLLAAMKDLEKQQGIFFVLLGSLSFSPAQMRDIEKQVGQLRLKAVAFFLATVAYENALKEQRLSSRRKKS